MWSPFYYIKFCRKEFKSTKIQWAKMLSVRWFDALILRLQMYYINCLHKSKKYMQSSVKSMNYKKS